MYQHPRSFSQHLFIFIFITSNRSNDEWRFQVGCHGDDNKQLMFVFSYHPTHLQVVDGDQLMVDTYYKQHFQSSSPGPVFLIQLWSDLNHLLVQLQDHPNYSQVHLNIVDYVTMTVQFV